MFVNPKIPVHIITGFLGSGKTTVISELLKNKSDSEYWAVIINEFGKVSIDFESLSPQQTEKENIFEVSGGCICCSARDNFEQNLQEIIDNAAYNRIIIEPSGLGGVEMIAEIIKSETRLKLMPVIGLVALPSLFNERLQLNAIYKSQLLQSDILVLSQSDTASDVKEVENAFSYLQKTYPDKLFYSTAQNGHIIGDVMKFEMDGGRNEKFRDLIFAPVELHAGKYFSKSMVADNDVRYDDQAILAQLRNVDGVLRAKGFLHTTSGWRFVNYTSGLQSSEPCESKSTNILVVISQNNLDDLKLL